MLHDPARLAALHAAAVLDTPPDAAFDRLSQLARDALATSAAYVVFVAADRQFIKSCSAVAAGAGGGTSGALSHSLCRYAVESGEAVVISDAAADPRFASHPAVVELGIRAYLGAPIVAAGGAVVGTVCVSEPRPRAWDARDLAVLGGVAAAAGRELDLRATNRRLAERESELAMIFNGATDLMFLIGVGEADATGRREYRCASVNAAYRALTGLSDAALIGRAIEEIVPAEHAAYLRRRYDEAVGGGEVLRYEEQLDLPAARIQVETTLTPVRDDAGRCTHLLGVARDITARRAAEEAVRASEGRLRAMQAATPVGVFEADLDGRLRVVNPRICELWALDAAEVLGLGWQSRVHVADLPSLMGDWLAAVRAGDEFSCAYRLLVPMGRGTPETRWVHARSAPLRDDAGRVVGSVGTVEDVTERHRAETTQRRLTGILEAMTEVVTVATPTGRIEYLNAAGRRLLGIAGDATAVRTAGLDVRALQPQFAPGGSGAAAIATAIVEGAWRGETMLARSDGREIPVEQVILAHRGPDGEIEYLSSILRDVTERRQAEATLRSFALVDELTGLYNRRGFLALAEREWEGACAAGEGGLLLYLDLDDFKAINDSFGHAEGDRALRAVGAAFRSAFREADVLARLGGDEFVAFARCGRAGQGGPVEGARAAARRIRARLASLLAEATPADAPPYLLAGSAGVAILDPAAPATLSTLMVEADAALYARKRARRAAAVAA